jgi:hypothetical protein
MKPVFYTSLSAIYCSLYISQKKCFNILDIPNSSRVFFRFILLEMKIPHRLTREGKAWVN